MNKVSDGNNILKYVQISQDRYIEIDKLIIMQQKHTLRRQEIVNSAIKSDDSPLIQWRKAFWIWIVLLIIGIMGGVLYAIGVIVAYIMMTVSQVNQHKQYISQVLHDNAYELHRLEQLEKSATDQIAIINNKYDRIVQRNRYLLPPFPPDWNEQKLLALKRDNFKCTSCGWPDGYQKRMRYLRVHYIVPISLGGTECLTNLKTLCHICSRRVEGRYSADRKRRAVVAK